MQSAHVNNKSSKMIQIMSQNLIIKKTYWQKFLSLYSLANCSNLSKLLTLKDKERHCTVC